MTPEELKEIEERYSMSLKTFSLNNLARLGVDVRGEILDLLAYIKELESQAIRWIPVGEKLPEIKGDAFLAYDCDEESMWIESSTRFMKWNNVTHWAELPAPPKEKG